MHIKKTKNKKKYPENKTVKYRLKRKIIEIKIARIYDSCVYFESDILHTGTIFPYDFF